MNLAFNTLSLEHTALVSHGPELQGSGTVVFNFEPLERIVNLEFLLSQVNPFPSKGEVQVHVKSVLMTLSCAHTALASHGPELQGSGTV